MTYEKPTGTSSKWEIKKNSIGDGLGMLTKKMVNNTCMEY